MQARTDLLGVWGRAEAQVERVARAELERAAAVQLGDELKVRTSHYG